MSNHEVTPSERSTAVVMLQKFLLSVIGEGVEAVNRSKQLAIKFEQHVFSSTKKKEEYMSLITERMQKVQQQYSNSQKSPSEENISIKSNPPPPPVTPAVAPPVVANPSDANPSSNLSALVAKNELSESDKIVVQQKVQKLAHMLSQADPVVIKITASQYSSKLTADSIRKYNTLKTAVHRQLSLIRTGQYIFSVQTATNLVDQLQHFIVQLNKFISEMQPSMFSPSTNGETSAPANKHQHSKSSNSNVKLEEWEQCLLDKLKKSSYFDLSFGSLEKEHAVDQVIGEWLKCRKYRTTAEYNKIDTLIRREMNSLMRRNPDLEIVHQFMPWGCAIRLTFQDCSLGLHLPHEYPSPLYSLFALREDDNISINFCHQINTRQIRTFAPYTLSSFVSILIYSMQQKKEI